MVQKLSLCIGIVAIALVYTLNLSYAHNNYGILENNLALAVIAQANSSTRTGTGTSTEPKKEYNIDRKWGECTVVINKTEVKGQSASCSFGDKYVSCPSCVFGDY